MQILRNLHTFLQPSYNFLVFVQTLTDLTSSDKQTVPPADIVVLL